MQKLSLWLLLMLPCASFAQSTQPFQRGQRLLFWEGTLRGSPRVMGLSGAYVGIAEGAEGFIRNPAALAAKDPHFENDLDVDLGGTMHFLFPGGTSSQDWDNDGRTESLNGPISSLGTTVLYSALALRYKWFGFGIGVDDQNFIGHRKFAMEDFDRYYNVNLVHVFASVAFSVWRDQILFGGGVETTHAFLTYMEKPETTWLPSVKDGSGYHGWGIQLGALWRPENQDYRVGVSFKPAVVGWPVTPDRTDIGGITPFAQISTPARLSIGGSVALGWGRHYNITSPDGWEDLGTKDADGNPERTAAMRKFLITTQLDLFFPVQGAVAMAGFLDQPLADAIPAGNRASFLWRLGVEKDVITDRLRARLGGYLEPPINAAGWLRPHVTFGGEIYLFKLGRQRLSFGISFDFASYYSNLSFAVLTWK